MRDAINTLEEISLNAWPSLQTVLYDGWVLRFANGYTKRANSINPLSASTIPFDQKLRYCEELYKNKNLDVVFKITPEEQPANLDFLLFEQGYRKDSLSSVQCLELKTVYDTKNTCIILDDKITTRWLESISDMNRLTNDQQATLEQMLNSIIPSHCFASFISDGKIISCGLGVLQTGFIGLFDIITDEQYRQHGFGKLIIQSILNWGIKKGAHIAYLQVLKNNIPALHLYSKLGFSEYYQYWYRIKN